MEGMGTSKMQIFSLATITGSPMDSGKTAGARLGKQLFLWLMRSELGDYHTPIHRLPLLPDCMGPDSYLE